MDKTIGTITTVDSDEHPYLRGLQVRIVAIFKGSADLDADLDAEVDEDLDAEIDAEIDEDGAYITSDEELARADGVTADDRVEVQPFVEELGRYSFATSDPRAVDVALFSHLRTKR